MVGRDPMRMRKSVIFSLLCGFLLLVAGLRIAISFVRFSKVERKFASIQVGQSRQEIISRLGKPHYYSGRCGVIADPLKTCTLEYVYGHPFAPLIPDYYIVSFSSDERVIQADRYSSP